MMNQKKKMIEKKDLNSDPIIIPITINTLTIHYIDTIYYIISLSYLANRYSFLLPYPFIFIPNIQPISSSLDLSNPFPSLFIIHYIHSECSSHSFISSLIENDDKQFHSIHNAFFEFL